MNLIPRLELAGGALLATLDAEQGYMPMGGYEAAHDLGRWWDAVLRLEEAIGFSVPAELERASMANLQLLTDNPDRLLMNNAAAPWLADRVMLNPHNFRETLLTYAGLVRRRRSGWAAEAGGQLVRSMERCIDAGGRLDLSRLGSWGKVPCSTDESMLGRTIDGWADTTGSIGRALEAVIAFHQATGDTLALDIAGRIAAYHLANTVMPDGTMHPRIVAPNNPGHNHSYHGTLRGLLRFGLLTGERRYVDAVERTFRKALPAHCVKKSGWAPHDLGKHRFDNEEGDPVAEPASAGDSAQLALWLARDAGYVERFDDAERLVRARLLPMQLTHADAHGDAGVQFPPRTLGAWAVHAPPHANKGNTPDILAAVTHSLCDVQRSIVATIGDLRRIDLHFDYEDDDLRIASRREQSATLTVEVKRPVRLAIRVPGWVSPASVAVAIDAAPVRHHLSCGYVQISAAPLRTGQRITLSHDLPERRSVEVMPSGKRYTFAWHGDEVTGISPQDQPMPFYPRLSE
ncbi:MAG: hypothetical protein K8S99_09905 [Planctomycetes bacterium]|nr:hypothetical protein [Planctomycetota bacterium]